MKKEKKEKNKYHWLNRFLVITDVILAAFLIYLVIPSMKKENAGKVTQRQEEQESIEEAGLRGGEEELLKAAGAQTEEEGTGESGEDGEIQEEKAAVSGVKVYPLVADVGVDVWIEELIDSEGIYWIYAGEKYGFITEDGKKLSTGDGGDPFIYDVAYPFHEGLACVCIDGKYGYIDADGKVAIPLLYDRATPFMEGLAYFAVGDTCGFMDHTGNVVFELTCDSVSSFQEGLAYFSVGGRYGYLDQNGQVVIEALYDDAEYFRNGLARVRKGSGYGVIGRDGSYILEPEYDSIEINDDFMEAVRGEQKEYFDTQGKRLPFDEYDSVSPSRYLLPCSVIFNSGLIEFSKDGKEGLADDAGTILFEPVYDRLDVVSQQGIVLVRNGEKWGVANLSGEILIPFQYSDIRYMPYVNQTGGGTLIVSNEEGKTGSLDVTDFSQIMPCVYDSIEWYDSDRAIVSVDGKYGAVDWNGDPIVPIVYSQAGFFQDGAVYAKEESGPWRVWRAGEAEVLGNSDRISRVGDCYMVEDNGKYGLLNEFGRVALGAVYDNFSNHKVYGSSYYGSQVMIAHANRYSNRGDVIIKIGEAADVDLSDILLKNEITPMTGVYWEFVKDSFVSEPGWFGDETVDQDELNGCRETYKLFDLAHTGELILHFYAEPYDWHGFPLSYSGFYGIQNGQVIQLLSGYECGGSSGGDYVILQYDEVNDAVMLGSRIHMGGFGGNAYGGEVYGDRDGGIEFVTSFMYIAQSVGNYADEELLEHAELFYGGEEQDIPFTRETILKALDVTEYNVDGEQCTVEAYREIMDRYRELSFLN